jgi:hypothetical protein
MGFGFSLGKGREIHPLDILRRRLTRGLEVATGDQTARRGGEVEALVTISSGLKLGDLEVGVVCTEYYDEQETTRDADGSTSLSRSTSDEVAHESWSQVENVSGVQSLRFTIPADAPFRTEVSASPSSGRSWLVVAGAGGSTHRRGASCPFSREPSVSASARS